LVSLSTDFQSTFRRKAGRGALEDGKLTNSGRQRRTPNRSGRPQGSGPRQTSEKAASDGCAFRPAEGPWIVIERLGGILERKRAEEDQGYFRDLQEDVEMLSGLTTEVATFARSELKREPVVLKPVAPRAMVGRAVRVEAAFRWMRGSRGE